MRSGPDRPHSASSLACPFAHAPEPHCPHLEVEAVTMLGSLFVPGSQIATNSAENSTHLFSQFLWGTSTLLG